MYTGAGVVSFPMLFMAVIAEDQARDMALGVALDGEAGEAGAVGIEERSGRLRRQLVHLAVDVALVEQISLPKEGDGRRALFVDVVPGESIELRGGEAKGGWMQGDYEAFCEDRGLLFGVDAVG